MYEDFYNLKEKPFTLLPDPEFLYLSGKHRMALTLLEYGLMNHAGFTVISGDIGAGKTTLIRHLLNNMDREYTVGLISNTHSDFGELLQWILLAFNLDHAHMNKVEMYQRFVDFIIDEYAHNRTTVLIVDEAQNMSTEALEELRMLSNVNADKHQALQVVLVGQRELREKLRRPELFQFAQRISVDYHLEALSEDETANYIRHRLEVAGGDTNLFDAEACAAIYRYSNGVPRLINLLCDTSLVYGYAEQKNQIDAGMVTDVARDKQQGGIFPTFESADPDSASTSKTGSTTGNDPAPAASAHLELIGNTASDYSANSALPGQSFPAMPAGTPPESTRMAEERPETVRLALCGTQENLLIYLSGLLAGHGFDIVDMLSPDAEHLTALDPARIDLLLVNREEGAASRAPGVAEILTHWTGPVLYTDAAATEHSLRKSNPEFGKHLAGQIMSLVSASRSRAAAIQGS